MYELGTRFVVQWKSQGSKFTKPVEVMLCQVGPFKVCLIQLSDGNRLSEPITVEDVPVSYADLKRCMAGFRIVCRIYGRARQYEEYTKEPWEK